MFLRHKQLGAAFAVELINAFAFTWWRVRHVLGAEFVLEFMSFFVEKVAASLRKSPLELVGDTRYETKSGIWT